jgi:hypothetical protein
VPAGSKGLEAQELDAEQILEDGGAAASRGPDRVQQRTLTLLITTISIP